MSSIDPSLNPINNPQINTGSTSSFRGVDPRYTLPDNLVSAAQSSNANSASFSSAFPTLLSYLTTVAKSTRENKEALQDFYLKDSLSYLDARLDASITADNLRKILGDLQTFKQDYKDVADDLKDIVNHLNDKIADFNDKMPTAAQKWNDIVNATNVFKNTDTSEFTPQQLQNFNNTYHNAVNEWNSYASSRNNAISSFNQSLAEYAQGVGAIQPTIDELNANIVNLSLNVPPIGSPPSFNAIPPLAILPTNLTPANAYTPNSPSYAPLNPYTPPEFNEDSFNADYIDPLKALIKSLVDVNDKIDKEIVYQNTLSVTLGLDKRIATVKEAVSTKPAGGGISSLNSDKNASPGFEAKFSQSHLDTIYNSLGVPAGSPLIPNIAGYTESILSQVRNISVTDAEALIAGAPVNDASVSTAAALAFLKNAQAFVNGDGAFRNVLEALKGSPELAGKTDAELEQIARGISSQINLIILKAAIAELATSIGAAGLVPQLLSSLGSISKDDVVRLLAGNVTYKSLLDSPFQQILVLSTITSTLKNELKISQERADTLAREALQTALQSNESDAKAALNDAINKTLSSQSDLVNEASRTADIASQRLDENAARASELSESLKADVFSYQLKQELAKADLSDSERSKVESDLEAAAPSLSTVAAREESALNILNKAGVENAQGLAAQASALANNPLQNILPDDYTQGELSQGLSGLITASLNRTGANKELIEAAAAQYSDLVFNAPSSIKNLIEVNTKNYENSVQEAQANHTQELFKDTILPTESYLAKSYELFNPANILLFADKITVAGYQGKHMGAGTPAGYGYQANSSAPV